MPSPHLTELPEGVLPLTPGLQGWVGNDFLATEARGYQPDHACLKGFPSAARAALHGMIWMTLAFFMLAGRLPVLMFSFMIRTFVSFCGQEDTAMQLKPGHSREIPQPSNSSTVKGTCSMEIPVCFSRRFLSLGK